MRCSREMMRLYAVTDRAWTGRQTLYEQVECALMGGVTCVQLREKNLGEEDFEREAMQIGPLCARYGVPLIINDNVELAVRCGADGVHVGQHDRKAAEVRRMIGESMILGVSARTVEAALEAEAVGADYLGVGAVFGTSTKADASCISLQTLREICSAVSIPVVAIGGVSRENILRLTGSGAAGAAIVSAIFSAEDIESACRELRALSEKMACACMEQETRGE